MPSAVGVMSLSDRERAWPAALMYFWRSLPKPEKFRKNAAASDGSAEEEPAEGGVKSFLDFTPRAADNIYEEMKKKGISMSFPQLLQNLLELQMEGAVKQEGGYFFLSGEKL